MSVTQVRPPQKKKERKEKKKKKKKKIVLWHKGLQVPFQESWSKNKIGIKCFFTICVNCVIVWTRQTRKVLNTFQGLNFIARDTLYKPYKTCTCYQMDQKYIKSGCLRALTCLKRHHLSSYMKWDTLRFT